MNQQEEMFYSAATSCGGRAENQDNFAVGGAVPFWTPEDPESVFGTLPAGQTNYFLVADGVGGGEAGAEASRRAAQAAQRCWEATTDVEETPLDALAFALADAAYAAVADLNGSLAGSSASTLVLALLRGKDFFVLNIGDSPALLFPSEGEPRVLTEEHNLAGYKKQTGEPVLAGDACYLLRFLGMQGGSAEKLAHTCTGELHDGDALMLCSDGVTGRLDAGAMRDYLFFDAGASELVQFAGDDPYADNCTAVIVRRMCAS